MAHEGDMDAFHSSRAAAAAAAAGAAWRSGRPRGRGAATAPPGWSRVGDGRTR